MARSRISPVRNPRSFRRRPGHKAPRSITLIVCEGETEQEYFKALRMHYGLTTAEIVIAEDTKGSAPISVVNYAEEKAREPGGYDRIYCVFDRDHHESFGRAREKIRDLARRQKRPWPIEEAISIPCFEVWILLHHERTDAPFPDCDAVIAHLRTIIRGYKKADAGIVQDLMGRIDTAMDNARWLEGRAAMNDYNPYTQVHRILECFQSLATQETP